MTWYPMLFLVADFFAFGIVCVCGGVLWLYLDVLLLRLIYSCLGL